MVGGTPHPVLPTLRLGLLRQQSGEWYDVPRLGDSWW